MPRYFFNIYHDRVTRDDLGTELPDKHAAWEEASRSQTSSPILYGKFM